MPLSRQHRNLKNINIVLPDPTDPTIQWFPLTRNNEFLVNGLFFGANAIISGPSRSTDSPKNIFSSAMRLGQCSSNKSPST
ncbi:MAG: hypothetical protein EZS28_020607, partial [Streblomastix strix]